ncbi:MAG: TadE/TadG family type IV pilus assembly protein [Rhizobiaceae bacterium]
MFIKLNNKLAALRSKLHAFSEDRSGAAAVEFVFIATLLITLYLGTQQVSLSLNMNKKIGRSASAVGDMIAQKDQEILLSDLQNIMKIGAASLLPYAKSKPEITVTGINATGGTGGKVEFSQRLNTNGTFSVPVPKDGTISDVDSRVNFAGTFLVRVNIKLRYQMITSWRTGQEVDSDGNAWIPMSETYYLRPRNSDQIVCKSLACTAL